MTERTMDEPNIHDIPFSERFKPRSGKLDASLDDLAHLINMEVAAGDKHAQKGEDHHTAASIQQDELDRRQKAMIEASAELCTNFAAGRMESPKMDALPNQDRKEVVEMIVEAFEADKAERKAANRDPVLVVAKRAVIADRRGAESYDKSSS